MLEKLAVKLFMMADFHDQLNWQNQIIFFHSPTDAAP